MQKTPKATFKGQVKRGFDNWKNGRVEFYVEGEVGSWTVQLYHDVNPGRVVHRYKVSSGRSRKKLSRVYSLKGHLLPF